VLDTAINYRCQRSERAIGRTLAALIHEGSLSRDEVILCTKGGYLPFDNEVPADPGRYVADTILNPGLASYEDIVAGCHCLTPRYLAESLDTSLKNLRVETIDVYYLHNPEQQLDEVDRATFRQRLAEAFRLLEERARNGAIRSYGVATWNGLRANPKARQYLGLEALVELARETGGEAHRFRTVQLPYNLAMPEAFAFKNQTAQGELYSPIEAARHLGLSVVVSASLLQSQLTRLPATLAERIPDCRTSAQRALQFVRSTPGVATALVGMKSAEHVEENLALAAQPLLPLELLEELYDRGRRS
jgi:aryl-alcohol dehydrogenase-like predicted oxidoreductase